MEENQYAEQENKRRRSLEYPAKILGNTEGTIRSFKLSQYDPTGQVEDDEHDEYDENQIEGEMVQTEASAIRAVMSLAQKSARSIVSRSGFTTVSC